MAVLTWFFVNRRPGRGTAREEAYRLRLNAGSNRENCQQLAKEEGGGSRPARRTWGFEIGLTRADGAKPIVEMLWKGSTTVEGGVETPWRTIWQNGQEPESPTGGLELPGIAETARDDRSGPATSG